MNVARFLEKAARTYPDAPAVQQGSTRLRYKQLTDRVQGLAANLRAQNLRPGDRVGIWMANSPTLVEVLFAVFWGGLVAVPISARLHSKEVEHIVADSAAKVLIYDDDLAAAQPGFSEASLTAARSIPVSCLQYGDSNIGPTDRAPSDDAWLFYTSGTTGKPKGAVLTHGNLVAQSMGCLADLYSFQPEDVVLHAAPLTHGSGMHLLPALARGAFNVIAGGRFDAAAVFRLIATFRVTAIAFLAPTQVVSLIESEQAQAADLSSLKAVIYGGGPMYLAHIRRALQLWGPIWIQLYGQGETPMTGTYLRREAHVGEGADVQRRLSSIGIPRTNVELSICDNTDKPVVDGEVGEICVRAPTVMKAYWRNPQATEAALRGGWLHTGDLGYQDPDGHIHLVARAKDMIITGGNNVYAREVEDVIMSHPDVVEAAVIGVSDRYWGESVHAVIVLREGRAVSADAIIEHCRQSLASYKKPRSIEFVNELPKNAYGKVLKTALRTPSGPVVST